MPSNQKTVDVNYYGTWNESQQSVEWQNVEMNSSDGARREIRNESDDNGAAMTPQNSQLYTESFEEYNNNNVQQEYAKEDEKRRSQPQFLGQSGYQTTYGFDPFGQPSVPSTRTQVNQSLQQSVYNQPVTRGEYIIIPYCRWYWQGKSAPEGEFRLKWDDAAQWFGIEQVVY